MALHTLKFVEQVNGYPIGRIPVEGLSKQDFENLVRGRYITINERQNRISFTLQRGPVGENGITGCQIDEMLKVAKLILMNLDDEFPCQENKEAIKHIHSAEQLLRDRHTRREAEGKEGFNVI